MILVIARSRPVKIDFELEEEVSEGGEKIMTAVWKEFFFFFLFFYQRGENFRGLECVECGRKKRGSLVYESVYIVAATILKVLARFSFKKKSGENGKMVCKICRVGVNVIRFVMDSARCLVSFLFYMRDEGRNKRVMMRHVSATWEI